MTTCLAKKDLDQLNLANVSEERKGQIMAIKDSIVLSRDATLEYANDASKNLTEFSSDLLKTVKAKDSPDIENLLTELMSGLSKIDASTLQAKKPNFLARLFGVDKVQNAINQCKDVETLVDTVQEKLAMASFQLKKDIELSERYLERNVGFISSLDNFIMAGGIRAQEEQAALDEMQKDLDTSDQLAVINMNNRQGELDRFNRKLHDLKLLRSIAVQNIPQIILIADGDSVLIEKIDTSINAAIPLWKNQMVIAIQMMRQKGALELEKAVTQTTNNLITKNSELLKENSLEIARSLETPIVDIATLKQSSQNLIETLNGIKQIREEGKQSRLKAAQELGQLQIQLNEQLLLVSGK